MISKSLDSYERIIGYIEWREVGQSGFDKYQGEYIWVNDMWIHEEFRNGETFKELVNDVLFKAPQAKWCYFKRGKYKGRLSKLYTRNEFMKLVSKSMVGV